MEFTWTTFALEILNFLVLLWILKRFLYLPIKNVVEKRKAAIDASVAQAHSTQEAADALKRQYEGRMAEWEAERARARTQLADEIATERARLFAQVLREIEQERDKDRALEQRRAVEVRQKMVQEANADAAEFAARLLIRLATPALEQRIGEVAMEDLRALPQGQLSALRQACLKDQVRITSAFVLSPTLRNALAAAITELARVPVECEFAQDAGLIAGLRIGAGPWLLRCNLRDELAFFADAGQAMLPS